MRRFPLILRLLGYKKTIALNNRYTSSEGVKRVYIGKVLINGKDANVRLSPLTNRSIEGHEWAVIQFSGKGAVGTITVRDNRIHLRSYHDVTLEVYYK